MKRLIGSALLCLSTLGVLHFRSSLAQDAKPATKSDEETIDFEKARSLFQRRQRGEKLTADEENYIQRAMAARRRMNQEGRNPDAAGGRRAAITPRESTGLVPLCDMPANDRYQGQDGGLYGGGKNQPPDAHRRHAESELARIEPLDAEGHPNPTGTIGFISISMSNATQEFSRFVQLAYEDHDKSPRVAVVDCAQGGQAMAEWVSPEAQPWRETDRRLAAKKLAPKQVQLVWIKAANKSPSGSLEDHGRKLERDTRAVIQNAKAKFPNLRIAYLSSRIYGGYTSGNLNPEPYAYESAFVVRWLIQSQIEGNQELNWDSTRGPVRAPLLLWGPYLWADGTKPRGTDQLIYTREDLAQDGTHPSQLGREKVAQQLLKFCKTDPFAKGWYLDSK